jgi:hypothetical protein
MNSPVSYRFHCVGKRRHSIGASSGFRSPSEEAATTGASIHQKALIRLSLDSPSIAIFANILKLLLQEDAHLFYGADLTFLP